MLKYLNYLGYQAYDMGGNVSSVLAAILYQDTLGDFVYTTDGSSNVILDNQGSLGATNDGLLYSGRGIELGATNDTTIGDAAKWTTWFSFTDNVHHKVFGVKVFVSETINSVLVSASEPSTATMAAFDANPNLVGKLALSGTGTISEVDLTLVAADEYYMCSENSGAYLVDVRAGYGAEEVTNGTFDIDTVGWTGSGNVWSTGGKVKVYQYPTYNDTLVQNRTLSANTHYIISYDIDEITDPLFFNTIQIRQSLDNTLVYGSVSTAGLATTGSFSELFKTTAETTYYINSFVNISAANITVYMILDNISIREATATEIANYPTDDSVRLNADLQQKGIQATAFVDGAGVPTAYSNNLLQFNGDGRYVNTQKMPPSDSAWEIDLVMDFQANGLTEWSGARGISAAEVILVGSGTTGGLVAYIGGTYKTSTALSVGLHYVRLEFDGAGNGAFVIDNSVTIPYTASTYSQGTSEKMFIGIASRSAVPFSQPHFTPIAVFQYKLGTRTADERNAYYANLKTIYPTLP